MELTWSVPAALWLLAVVPLVWVARRFARTNFNPRQQVLQAVVRSLLLAALAMALARPVISLGSSRLSIVHVVDVSHSVSSAAIATAADRIDELNDEVRPAHSAIVVFGMDAATLASSDALRALAEADPASPAGTAVDRDGTDVERALRKARAELASGHVPRLILYSDGHQTAGDVGDVVVRLATEGVPVFVEPLAVRDLGDTWVDVVHVPARVQAGTLVTVDVVVGSQLAGPGRVELHDNGTLVASRDVALVVGETVVPMEVAFDVAGARVLDATVARAGDPLEVNNRLAREAVVEARTPVLYVEGSAASARYLQEALEQSGFDVTVRPPSGLPGDPDAFDAWDAVILSDVAGADIPDRTMTALGDWVELRGGGLFVAGGEAVFGETADGGPGGYRETELERLTPVTFERKDEPEVALIIILDKSWSMAGLVMELSKAAAQAAVDVLEDEQTLGIVTFNDGLNWDVTLRNVGENRDSIAQAIRLIEPSGHTLIYPAIEQAYLALRDARARAKHVVLLSDGRSYPDDYEGLLEQMVEAKITVSSIAVGPAADVELLTNIAEWGRGRSYIVEDAQEVPQIFVQEAKNAATPSFDEGSIAPVLKARGFLEGVDFTRAPSLRGRTATVLKDTALELLATEEGDPLLAFWPIGLGRSAVFASDVKDRWAADWIRWSGYGPFFAATVRAVARQRPPQVSLGVAQGPVRAGARPLQLSVEAREASGEYRDLLRPIVWAESADGSEADVTLRQTAPGRYEASLTVDARQPLSLTVTSPESGIGPRLVVPDVNAEYRLRPVDLAGLEGLALATGGSREPDGQVLRASGAGSRVARRALWPALVAVALGLWLVDILLRRVRVFEPA